MKYGCQPGQVVHKLRIRCRYTQLYLAEKSGLEQSAISRIEHGTQKVTIDDAVVFAKILGVRPSFIAFNALPRRKR